MLVVAAMVTTPKTKKPAIAGFLAFVRAPFLGMRCGRRRRFNADVFASALRRPFTAKRSSDVGQTRWSHVLSPANLQSVFTICPEWRKAQAQAGLRAIGRCAPLRGWHPPNGIRNRSEFGRHETLLYAIPTRTSCY